MRTHINCKAMLEADRMPPSFASPIHANSQEIAMATKIKVNGVDRTVDVDGDTPLLWVLRDVLGMTGTKFGCGVALCGACTVHIDGVAARSCITPIDSIGNSKITTIEAIGATAAGAKIQKAWLDREVVQCGYCQSGQIMSAFVKQSSRPRSRVDREADNDPRSPHFPSRQPVRERPLPAQLPAGRSGRGRRPDAEPEPDIRRRRSRSGCRRQLRAQRLHPHRKRWADRPDYALCRDGPGHLYLDSDADRRRAGGRPETGAAGACSAQRKALRKSPVGRGAGNRQLERGTRGVAAPAPSRRDCENHARVRGGEATECRSGVLPGAKR